MGQYILKDALAREIRKRLLPVIRDKHYDEWEEGQDSERIAILDIIDTLGIKEVDLEKEIHNYLDNHGLNIQDGGRIVFDNGDIPNFLFDFRDIAKYFYELGLAQKG